MESLSTSLLSFRDLTVKVPTAKLKKLNEHAHTVKHRLVNFSAEKVCHHLNINASLYRITCKVYPAINYEHTSTSISELLKLRNNKYKLRGTNIKATKDQNIELRPNSWRNIAPKLWNSIPDKINSAQSLKAFKNSIRELDLLVLLFPSCFRFFNLQ